MTIEWERLPIGARLTAICDCGEIATVELVGIGRCCESELCAMQRIEKVGHHPTTIERNSPHVTLTEPVVMKVEESRSA